MSTSGNWRDDPSLESYIVYKKRFAIVPSKCSDGTTKWFKYIYIMYRGWICRGGDRNNYSNHLDKEEILSEQTYMIRKLVEGF